MLDYDGASGTVLNWYAFGSGPNDVLARINAAGADRSSFIPDILGSVVGRLGAGNGTLTKAGFQTFGESTSISGKVRYTGARIDAETNGLYDFRARMYSPKLGRFLQPDPIGYDGGINLYAYVDNDPLNLVDIYGLAADSPMRSRSGYLYESVDALFQAPRDIRGYASDLMSDPLDFLQRAGPTLAGLGMAVPLMRVGPVAAGGIAGSEGAANAANGVRLAQQLTADQASSLSTAAGELTPEAIANSRMIMQPSRLANPDIPAGFAKFTTEPLPNPLGGSFTTRFYMNPATGKVFYGLDYKTLIPP